MKKLEIIIMIPLVILASLPLMVIDLVRKVRGKPSLNEEWDDIFMGDIMNQGQGEVAE